MTAASPVLCFAVSRRHGFYHFMDHSWTRVQRLSILATTSVA